MAFKRLTTEDTPAGTDVAAIQTRDEFTCDGCKLVFGWQELFSIVGSVTGRQQQAGINGQLCEDCLYTTEVAVIIHGLNPLQNRAHIR